MAEKKRRNDASSSSSGGGSNRGESVVGDVGRRRSSCGYCRSGGNTSISHGLWAQSLTVDHYQALLDRGWRRSGCFLYKPEMEKTCCPAYTIRLKASDFCPSKEQLRVSKRMQRWVPFEIARPLLDKKPYAILSDFAALPNGEYSEPKALEDNMEMQHDDPVQVDMNDIPVDEDEELTELDFEDSDDESGSVSGGLTAVLVEDGNVGDTLIGLKGSRLRYQDLQHAFGPPERRYLETQLHRYMRAVGTELSKQMVYSLG